MLFFVLGFIISFIFFYIVVYFFTLYIEIKQYFGRLNKSKNFEKLDSRSFQVKNERYDKFRWITLILFVLSSIFLARLYLRQYIEFDLLYVFFIPFHHVSLLIINICFFALRIKKGKNNKIDILILIGMGISFVALGLWGLYRAVYP